MLIKKFATEFFYKLFRFLLRSDSVEHVRVDASGGNVYGIGKSSTSPAVLTIVDVPKSSHQRCSIKKIVFKISQNSQGNTCARVPFLISLPDVFSYEFC